MALMAVRRRFLHPLWLIASLPLYMGWRLLPALTGSPAGVVAGMVLLIAACAVVPMSVRRTDKFAWVGLIAMGFFSTLFVATVLRDLLLLAAHFLLTAAQMHALVVISARLAVVLTLAATFLGLLISRRPRLVEVEIPIAHLPKALHGFSIAQISDVHVGPTIKRGFVERLVERVNRLDADLIAVTGDLVDGTVHELSSHTAPLANLASRHGAYFVTGNHEYYSGEADWTREIRRLGLTVLKNQHVVLKHDGALLVLAGVTDYSAHRFDAAQKSDPAAALDGAPLEAGARILLAHQPSSADAAENAGFDVQISGHTHGGQFWPWNHFVRYFQPFTAGLHRLKRLWVYVNSGTGYWGPPNRFGVPAEITRIRLVPAAP
jgi:uncharacterized protein